VSDYLIYTPISGWQVSPESVAAFEWNGWQASSGISGRLGPEYAVKEVLIYAPRDDNELIVAKRIIVESYRYASGDNEFALEL